MTTLTLVVDKEKKTQYKDYVHFLDNYRNGRREESDNSSLSSSGRNSSSSINTDLNELPTKSFNEYLQAYNNKKFQPVRPKLEKPKSVKTEVFIEVNNTKNIEESMNGIRHVDEIAKVFEKPSILNEKPKFDQVKRSFNLNTKNQNNTRLNSNEMHQTKPIKSLHHSENHPRKTVETMKTKENIKTEVNGCNQENHPKKLVTLSKIIINGDLPPKPQSLRSTTPSPIPSKEYQFKLQTTTLNDGVPPPPPPPPSNFTIPPPKFTIPSSNSTPPPPPLPVSPSPVKISPKVFKASTLPRMPKNGVKQSDTIDSGTINRNDPRVKRAVYGALRNMYGTYHDQANDYLATLPKNRVKKANGLDSIINSIAAQGGLEKLCGRSKVEAD